MPTINFGVVAGDPAQSLFTGAIGAAAFPGASAANLTAAQNLYALLTGRVSGIDGDARLDENTNEYTYMGTRHAARADAGDRLLHPGLVALEAELHDQPRACATSCSTRSTR